MAEEGYLRKSYDSESESCSLFSVRRAAEYTSCITDDTYVSLMGRSEYSALGSSSSVFREGETHKDIDKTYLSVKGCHSYHGDTSENKSDYMSLRGNSTETFIDDKTACSITTLSVAGVDDDTELGHCGNKIYNLDDSFLSVKEASEDKSRNISTSLDQFTYNNEDIKPKQNESDLISFTRSGDKEFLCEICLEDDIKTKATHFCKNCGRNGQNMCYKCLRFHGKFTKHENVNSLLTNAKSLESAKARKEKTINEEQFAQDNTMQRKTSRLKLKQSYLNIAAQKDGCQCTAIDFAKMRNGNLIIADFVNKCLKIFCFDNLQLKEVFYLEDSPVCITCFPMNDIVAVRYIDALCLETFDDCQKTLQIYRRHGACNGLKSVGQYLYSLDGDDSTETLSIYYLQDTLSNPQLIKTIDLQQIGIIEPDQIDVDKFGETIYITDSAFGIFVLDKNGGVLMRTSVNVPRGISFDGSNKVFVCCNDSEFWK